MGKTRYNKQRQKCLRASKNRAKMGKYAILIFNETSSTRQKERVERYRASRNDANISKPMAQQNTERNVWIVIPAYNEGQKIEEVIKEIQSFGYRHIIVVDDGSRDATYDNARAAGATVLRHALNRGKGAATKTGIEAAKIVGADCIVTMDGDGQHDPKDIEKLLASLSGKVSVSLGTRLKDPQGMPWYKILHNWIGNFLVWYLYGLWVSDSQSGFRAYSQKAIHLINTASDRYEYDSEVIREIKKHRLRYREIPISVRYTSYSMGKQNKQSFANGVRTLLRMIFHLVQ